MQSTTEVKPEFHQQIFRWCTCQAMSFIDGYSMVSKNFGGWCFW